MKSALFAIVIVLLVLLAANCEPTGPAYRVGGDSPLRLEVWVAGRPAKCYHHQGRIYLEAQRGCDYEIHLRNVSGRRLAVALAVDGLNTIDARRTSAAEASKWVVEPYDTVVVSGWQVSGATARRFFFTAENDSYGAALGQTENLGLISAVVYQEALTRVVTDAAPVREEARSGGAPACPAEKSPPATQTWQEGAAEQKEADEYAATGMGSQVRNDVERIRLELESEPCQTIDLRYEYRDQLVRLGVVLDEPSAPERRENASGFRGEYCPPAGR